MVLAEKNELSRLLRSLQDKAWITSGEDFAGETRYWIVKQGLDKIVPLIAAARAHEWDALGEFSAEEAKQFKDNLKGLLQWVNSGEYKPAHLITDDSKDEGQRYWRGKAARSAYWSETTVWAAVSVPSR